jgi:hypothetical protein
VTQPFVTLGLASQRGLQVRDAFALSTGLPALPGAGAAAGTAAAPAAKTVERKPIEEAECPICYEGASEHSHRGCDPLTHVRCTKDIGKEPTVWCNQSCGNNIHEVCFKQWADKNKRDRTEVGAVRA